MAIPQHQFQLQDATQLGNSSTIDNQMSEPITFFNPFHAGWFAPSSVPATEVFDGDLRWSSGSGITKKRLKEKDFLEINNNHHYNNNNNNTNTNSQISSVDFLQSRSISTGLGLSLDDRRMVSSRESPVLSLFNDEINRELQRQDLEIDRLVKVQSERMRQAILEKVQAKQFQAISLTEERVFRKVRDKEVEVEGINKKNIELEEQMKQLITEVGACQHRAKLNENLLTTLKFNLRQILVQKRDSKEGCGDSEVDDTASCCNSGAIDFHLIGKENKDLKESMTCKVCKVNQVCMLLLPCRHLCICKDCESKLSFCPLCQSSKFIGMEIFM